MHDVDPMQFEAEQFEGEQFEGESDLPLHETEELEYASRLLEVSNEQELEQFLGDVFHAVANAAGRFASSDTGHALGAILKDAVGKALPVVGGALGRGGPDLAQEAGSLLGLELEGLSPEDQEFESARHMVRFAGSAYRNAAWARHGRSPYATARSAAVAAARRHAPGLLGAFGLHGHAFSGQPWQARRYGQAGAARPYVSGYRSSPYSASWQGQPYGGSYYYRRRHRHRPPWYGGYDQGADWDDDDSGAYDASPPDVYAPPPPPPAPATVVPMPMPVPVTAPVDAIAPPPVAADAPAPPPDPSTSHELGGFGGPGWWPDHGGIGNPRARSGHWERRDGVLIVHGV